MNRTDRPARTVRSAVCALAVPGLALGLGACSETVDKAVDRAVDETVKSPTLPWKKTVTLRGIRPSVRGS